MKAAYYDRQGPARDVLQVGDPATPVPGPGEVLVRIHASGVNPSDVKSRQGGRGAMPFRRVIPHSDGAGVVADVGGGIDRAWIGRRVWTHDAGWHRAEGTAAEYVALPLDLVAPLPDGMSFEEGACLGIPALTAHRCVFADGRVKGQTILVTGGAGSVGHYAVQFAKWGGARVIATVSGDAKAEHARAAGADHVVNYRAEDVAARIMELTDGAGVDRVVEVEFGGNLPVTERVIRPNGTVATYASSSVREPVLPFYPLMFKNVTLRMVLVYNMPAGAKQQGIRDIADAQAAGALTHAVGATFPLSEIAAAHEAVERGDTIGNVVVSLD